MTITWHLVPKDYEAPPVPDYIDAMNRAVLACPKHEWELLLDYDEDAVLHCTRCPAGIDDLYPDGHDMLFYGNSDDSIVVEMGRHHLSDEALLPIRIPVNAWVLSGRNYWGEYEVELIVEDRDPG